MRNHHPLDHREYAVAAFAAGLAPKVIASQIDSDTGTVWHWLTAAGWLADAEVRACRGSIPSIHVRQRVPQEWMECAANAGAAAATNVPAEVHAEFVVWLRAALAVRGERDFAVLGYGSVLYAAFASASHKAARRLARWVRLEAETVRAVAAERDAVRRWGARRLA